MDKSKKYYYEINTARAIALMFVVLGHSFPDADEAAMLPAAQVIFNVCYSFHMGLFFILSGFVFAKRFLEGKYNLFEQIKNKFCRLMIPYFVFSAVTLLLKTVFAKYANNSFEISEFYKIFLGDNPNGGLWYLWTLFIIMIIFLLIGKLKHREIIAAAVSIVFYILYQTVPYGFYSKILNHAIYFVIGILVFKYYGFIKKLLSNTAVGIAALAGFIAMHCLSVNIYIITCLLASIFILWLSIKICDTKIKNTAIYKILNELGTYSYDIYLISYFVQIPIRVVFYSIFPIPYWLLFAAMFTMGILIPYLVSKFILRKIPIANFLLLGNKRKVS